MDRLTSIRALTRTMILVSVVGKIHVMFDIIVEFKEDGQFTNVLALQPTIYVKRRDRAKRMDGSKPGTDEVMLSTIVMNAAKKARKTSRLMHSPAGGERIAQNANDR